ncbi:MAG: imidazolonepropionase [Phycisphaerae bacterium]
MRTLIDAIGLLPRIPPGPVRGADMQRVELIRDAALLIEHDRIAWFGPRGAAPAGPFDLTLSAAGNCVVPGFVDCHTHLVFAGNRAADFVDRIKGASYLELLQQGRGIHTTVDATRRATDDQLVALTRPRLARMLAAGTTTAEVKSGYGLTPADEVKMLRVVHRLAQQQPIELVGTYLAAHTVPREFAGRADAYLDTVLADDLLESLYSHDLAEFADVFCERGAFDLRQSERFLRECARHGLRPKLHAEQLSNSGATRLGLALHAASVDHLEEIDADTTALLADSTTIPVLLPGCSLFLNAPPAPARKLIDAGCPVALATDCNPGSSMIESMPLVQSLACCLLRMTPLEALVAATANAAAAIDRADRLGAIAVGHQADLLILDRPDFAAIAYELGRSPVQTVLKRGRIVHSNPA